MLMKPGLVGCKDPIHGILGKYAGDCKRQWRGTTGQSYGGSNGAITPPMLLAVDRWYQDFSQSTDEEVRELLERATERDTF
jgi:hypothetical protein